MQYNANPSGQLDVTLMQPLMYINVIVTSICILPLAELCSSMGVPRGLMFQVLIRPLAGVLSCCHRDRQSKGFAAAASGRRRSGSVCGVDLRYTPRVRQAMTPASRVAKPASPAATRNAGLQGSEAAASMVAGISGLMQLSYA